MLVLNVVNMKAHFSQSMVDLNTHCLVLSFTISLTVTKALTACSFLSIALGHILSWRFKFVAQVGLDRLKMHGWKVTQIIFWVSHVQSTPLRL